MERQTKSVRMSALKEWRPRWYRRRRQEIRCTRDHLQENITMEIPRQIITVLPGSLQEYQQENNVESTLMRIFFTSALTASVNAFVLNVSFMVIDILSRQT